MWRKADSSFLCACLCVLQQERKTKRVVLRPAKTMHEIRIEDVKLDVFVTQRVKGWALSPGACRVLSEIHDCVKLFPTMTSQKFYFFNSVLFLQIYNCVEKNVEKFNRFEYVCKDLYYIKGVEFSTVALNLQVLGLSSLHVPPCLLGFLRVLRFSPTVPKTNRSD